MTLPSTYVDPSPQQVADAEAAACLAALGTWVRAMLAAINVEADLPLDDPDVVARLGPAMPQWLGDAVARCQATVELGGLPTTTEGS